MIKLLVRLSLGLLLLSIFIIYVFYSCNPFLANKNDYYQMMMKDRNGDGGSEFMVPQELYHPQRTDLRRLRYPVVMKPNVCSGEGRQVAKIHNVKEAMEYIKNFDRSYGDNIIIQEFDPAPYEVGILYRRYPGEKHGRIVSLGNRSQTKKGAEEETVEFVPRSCFNVDCGDKSEWLTPENRKVLVSEIERMSEMNTCRLDVIFDDLDEFKAGRGFRIIEVNGRMGFNLANFSVREKFYRNFYNFFWLMERFFIGLWNIIYLNGLNVFTFFRHLFGKVVMAIREGNNEFLITQDYYEPSLLDETST